MFNTRHVRVSGLGNPEGSQKALNLLYAVRTLQARSGRDLGATFLSGTTISNSLTELYLLFKYLEGLDGMKYSYNNGKIAADPKLACENFIKALDTMPAKLIAKYTARNEELTSDLPILEGLINSSWTKDKELQELREEMTALNRKIERDIAEKKQHESTSPDIEDAEAVEMNPQSEEPDNVRPLHPPVERKIASGSDVVPDYVSKQPIHVPGNVYVVRPGARPKL